MPVSDHTFRHLLYGTCTCYNCLPEDKPSGSKHSHVEDIVKIKTKLSLTELHYVFFPQCTVQKNIKWIFTKWDGETWTGLVWLRIGTGGGHL